MHFISLSGTHYTDVFAAIGPWSLVSMINSVHD